MVVEQFINEKIQQIHHYISAVILHQIHYTELDKFVTDTMEEWTFFQVADDMPSNARERVFWHVIHEIMLNGAQSLDTNLYFKSEITTCLDFFKVQEATPSIVLAGDRFKFTI